MNTELPQSECFALLADRHRRLAVRTLAERGGSLSPRALAERVADHVYGNATDEHRQRIHVAFHHNHLPRLEDHDVVSYDPDDGTVTRGSNFETLAHYLEWGNAMGRPRATRDASTLSSRID